MGDANFENVKSFFVHNTEQGKVTARILKIRGHPYVGIHRTFTPKDLTTPKENKGVYFPIFAWKRFLDLIPEIDEVIRELTKEEQEAATKAHEEALKQVKQLVSAYEVEKQSLEQNQERVEYRQVSNIPPLLPPQVSTSGTTFQTSTPRSTPPPQPLKPGSTYLRLPPELRAQLKRKAPFSDGRDDYIWLSDDY